MSERMTCKMKLTCARGRGICCAGCERQGDVRKCGKYCENNPVGCINRIVPEPEGVFCGAKLRAVREKAGMSQTALAEWTKAKGPEYVEKWESGRIVPTQRMQKRICAGLGCRLIDLWE